MNLRPLLCCLCVALLAGIASGSTAADRYFRHYNNKQGLSHNTVTCSLQDRKGFLWFGTEDGLNRFDGHHFKTYRYNSYQPEASLTSDGITSLFEDSRGTLWVCTHRSVCRYDETADAFVPFRLPVDGTNNYFFAIREDRRGNLWFANAQRIVRYSPTDGQASVYPSSTYFSPACLEMTASGEPLFADDSSLFAYQSETDRFQQTPILTSEEQQDQTMISAICEAPQVGVFIGTNRKGLKLFHYQDGRTETILPDVMVRTIAAYDIHTYWIGTESGAYIYNIVTRETTRLRKSLTNDYALADNAVYSITRDREGGVWVGTFFGGISFLPYGYVNFRRFIGGKTHPQLPGNAIREICPDSYGNLWIGTEDNGINRYHLQNGEITNFSLGSVPHPLSATNIHGLFAEDDRLWVGTFNKGIDVLHLPDGHLVKRYTQAGTRNGLPGDFVLCFTRLSDGTLLVGTGNGTAVYDPQGDTFHPWQEIHALTRQIYPDTRGNIWIVTSNGLYRYDTAAGQMHAYHSELTHSQTIGSNNTTSVFEDSRGRIWVTTVYGFSLYNETIDGFNRITVEDGLPSNIVYRILEDGEGIFWISTANGLVKFNPDTHAMRTFSYTDGLHETQFNYCSSYKAPDGTMYMGTINGMISFRPADFREDAYKPPVYISRIHIPGRTAPPLDSVKGMETLRLPSGQPAFTLSYVALSYTSPGALRYAYRLDGVDKDWNYMDRNTDVTFANLSPGRYVFRVRSTNSSGVWQHNERALQIIVVPPFWATGWAFAAYGLLAALLAALFYNYKKKKLEKRHRADQELFESSKEKELYNAKIQFFTFITHEIRTPLTLISAPLEKIIRSGDGNASTKENLHTIEKNTQRLLDLSNQLLDFRKTESRGFRLNFVRTDLIPWMESAVATFRPSFEGQGKVFRAEIGDGRPLTAPVDRDALLKIVGNLLSNALKYSAKEVSLALHPDREGGRFTLSVVNDGMVIPEGEEEKIFTPFYRLKQTENMQGSGIGLSLAQTLAEYHNGSLTYHRTPDGRNEFLLTLPLTQPDSFGFEEEPAAPPAPAAEGKTSRPVVLVVEDQSDMRQFIANELAADYQVLEAGHGRAALEMLASQPVKLIISDVMMPVMDGFELCNAVKNDVNYSHIPFVILTAQHNLQSRLRGLNTGADAYIEKPFSLELLTSQIRNLLLSRERLSQAYLEKPHLATASLAVSPVDELFLNKLNAYIESNITNHTLQIENLSAEMGMSASSLYRKVKGVSGLSPVDFIRVVRLKKAVALMQAGESRMNEIAFRVGFSSPSYFSTCFQKQYGKSPSEYYREMANAGE